jgi:hypothetical protein
MVPTNATATSPDWVSIGVTPTTNPADIPFVLDIQPQALKMSTSKLWAVKTNLTNKLFSFTDSVTNIKITLGQPAEGYIGRVNTINGLVSDIILTWNRPSIAAAYQVVIAQNKDFTIGATTIPVATTESLVSVSIGPNQAAPRFVDFQPGTTYYWKLRITNPGYSLYSETRSFSIEPLPSLPSSILELSGPVNGEVLKTNSPIFSWQPLQNAVEYEFVLSEKFDMSSPLMDARVNTTAFQVLRKLDAGKTYFWRVRSTQPIVSDWSPISNFIIAAAVIIPQTPTASVPTLVVTLPPATHTELVFPPANNATAQIVPGYLVIAILVGLALTGSVLYLLLKKNGATVRAAGGSGPSRRREVVRSPSTAPPLGTTISTAPAEKKLTAQESPKAVWPSARKAPEPDLPAKPGKEETPVSRDPLAKSKDAATVIFAARSFMWLSAAGSDAAPETPDKERETLGKKIAAKIRDLAKKEPLYLRHTEDAAMLFKLWSRYGDGDETEKYLEGALKSRPENALRVIRCFIPQGTATAVEFTIDNYRALGEVVDPDVVYSALNKAAKFKLTGTKEAAHISPEDSGLVSSFMHLHLQEKNTG